jgi:hypothetical protein
VPRTTEEWPHALVLLGDQVYADEVAPEVIDYIRATRDPEVPPGETVANFEEYTRLYRASWSEPHIRWLLSTVQSAMVFDDHDVHDDWNTSWTWVKDMRATGWWDDRIVGGFMTYWLYQHMGNLSPAHLADDPLYAALREAEDGTEILREFAFRADREVAGTRWSYCRDFGRTRLIMVDSRAGRVLDRPESARCSTRTSGTGWRSTPAASFDHLLLGTSLPFLLAPGCTTSSRGTRPSATARGEPAARVGEKIRQRGRPGALGGVRATRSNRIATLMRRCGTGAHGNARPRPIVALSGDVHHAYLAEVGLPRGTAMRSAVYQATCSPFRNPLDEPRAAHDPLRLLARGHSSGELLRARAASRTRRCAGVSRRGPYFDNQVCFIERAGVARGCGCRRRSRARTMGFSLETVYEVGLA